MTRQSWRTRKNASCFSVKSSSEAPSPSPLPGREEGFSREDRSRPWRGAVGLGSEWTTRHRQSRLCLRCECHEYRLAGSRCCIRERRGSCSTTEREGGRWRQWWMGPGTIAPLFLCIVTDPRHFLQCSGVWPAAPRRLTPDRCPWLQHFMQDSSFLRHDFLLHLLHHLPSGSSSQGRSRKLRKPLSTEAFLPAAWLAGNVVT